MTCLPCWRCDLPDVMAIPLVNARAVTLVDADDFWRYGTLRWFLSPQGYVYRTENFRGDVRSFYLHRCILKQALRIDHANGDKLDNRRANLRACTQQQNMWNRAKRRDSRHPYKGVQWRDGAWYAQVQRDRFGPFDDIVDAASAYDDEARRRFGVFACVNFPREGERGALRPNDLAA